MALHDNVFANQGAKADELAPLARPVAPELAAAQRHLAERISSAPAAVGDAYRHTLQAGGKRLRPLLVLLAAKSVGEITPEAVRLAVAIEQIHIASMLHDDVVDQSTVRRGQASAQALWDNRVAVLTGDYLAADVYQCLSENQRSAALSTIAQAVIEMCSAEALELTEDAAARTEQEYFRIIAGKTATLLAAAAKVGGLASGASAQQVSALESYGHDLGMAFQIGDDLLDLYGDCTTLGKPVGKDLRSGHWSLAVKDMPVQGLQGQGVLKPRLGQQVARGANLLTPLHE